MVNDGRHAELRTIVLGRDYGDEVEVVSGLSHSDNVIISPPDSLVPGEEVRVTRPAAGPNPGTGTSAQNGN